MFKAESRSQNTSTTFPRTAGKVSFLNYHKYSFIKCLATAYMNFYLSTSDTNFLTTNWLIFLPVPHPLGTVTEATHFKVHFSVLAPISIVTTGQLSHWSNNVFVNHSFTYSINTESIPVTRICTQLNIKTHKAGSQIKCLV